MKNLILCYLLLFFFISCAQQKIEKPPKPGQDNLIDMKPTQKLSRLFNYINLGELKQNSDSLYCWRIENECHIIDGKTTIFSYYQTSGDDNHKSIPYTYAKGEFLEGKYQGKWFFYDKNGKIIKKEKWDNGNLIYSKENKY